MNGMNFKPFISKVLDSLSDENLSVLASLIGSHSNIFKHKSIDGLTSDDKGVSLMTLQLDEKTFRTGYLLYNNSYCVLLSYSSTSERITEFKIDIATKTYEVVKEYLTTDYLRHEVAIRTSGVSSADVVAALAGQNINVNGITSKGIANTGAFGNIGNVAISGDLDVSGAGSIEGKGKITGDEIVERIANSVSFEKVSSGTLVVDFNYVCATEVGKLMTFVVNGKMSATASTGARITIARFEIPKELYDQIVPFDNDGNVFYGQYQFYRSAVSGINNDYYQVFKVSSGVKYYLYLSTGVPSTLNTEFFFRITFYIGFRPNLVPVEE